jgi:hypothetical protein
MLKVKWKVFNQSIQHSELEADYCRLGYDERGIYGGVR